MKLEEGIAGGISLWDASKDLPRGPGRYRRRNAPIDRLIIHHSGALGPPGFPGLVASAVYVTAFRGWPGFAYTFWAPYHRVRDAEGNLMVYRGNADETRSHHTGAANDRGVALCLQGDLTRTGPSPSQTQILQGFIPWAFERYGFDSSDCLTWHSEIGKKKSCPGGPTVDWLVRYRESM